MKISLIKETDVSYRKVEGYNPYDYLEILTDEITGEPIRNPEGAPLIGLRVKYLLDWFHKFCEKQGKFGFILPIHIQREDGVHEFAARVYLDYKDAALATENNPAAGAIGVGYCEKNPMSESKYDPFASAQTKAVAEALKFAGFGCEVDAIISHDQKSEKAQIIVIDDDANEDKRNSSEPEPEVKVPSFKVPDVEDAKETDNEDAEVDYKDVVPEKKTKENKPSKKAKAKSEPAEEETSDSTAETKEEPTSVEEEPQDAPVETPEPDTTEEPEETSNAGDYIITTDDITPCPGLLMDKVDQPISVLGKDTAEKLVQAFGSEFNETFLEELNSYIGG